jgi:hypothetical protein
MEALRRVVLAAALAGGIAVPAAADENVTVVYRNGERASGRYDGFSQGRFYLDVSATDERKIPIGDIALIDLVGAGQGLPETELSQARGPQHLLLLKSGSAVKGQFVTIEGSDRNRTTVVFRAENGEERRVSFNEVGRLYLGNFPSQAPAGSTPATPATPATPTTPAAAGVVRVSANQKWVDSGLTVRQGQTITVESSGEVQLTADGSEKAGTAGAASGRRAAGSQAPSLPVGALIGRLGPNGAVFAIGNQTSIVSPGAGRLYLGVNDDENGDNQGYFDVRLSAGTTTPRRGR